MSPTIAPSVVRYSFPHRRLLGGDERQAKKSGVKNESKMRKTEDGRNAPLMLIPPSDVFVPDFFAGILHRSVELRSRPTGLPEQRAAVQKVYLDHYNSVALPFAREVARRLET